MGKVPALEAATSVEQPLAFQPSGCACSILLISILALSVVPVFTVLSFRIVAPVWQRFVLTLFTILAVLAMIETGMKVAFERVYFAPEGLTAVFVKHLRRRKTFFPRAEIISVTWEKGGGVFLKLCNGQWAGLPGVGRTNQGLANSVRAWLKRTPDSVPEK